MVQTAFFSYDYQMQEGQPSTGKCWQSPSSFSLSFSYTDNNGNDNTAFLNSVSDGDQIQCHGVIWIVEGVSKKTGNIQFSVDPGVTAPPTGVSDFRFSSGINTIVIASGESLSSSVDLTAQSVVMVITPPDWSPANITFQVSMDNVTFYNFFDSMGHEILRAIPPGTAMLVDPIMTQHVNYLRIRSGPSDNPVPQQADRFLELITEPVG